MLNIAKRERFYYCQILNKCLIIVVFLLNIRGKRYIMESEINRVQKQERMKIEYG